MKVASSPRFWPIGAGASWLAILTIFLAGARVHADQVGMKNGDHYTGQITSLTTNSLILKSDILGSITLPRDKVASILLGAVTETNLAHPVPLTNGNLVITTPDTNVVDFAAQLSHLGNNTNLLQQVQAQFLAGAGNEANDKFNDTIKGLMNGKISVNDLRQQVKTSVDQIHDLQKELGQDAGGGELDAYLSILDHFLKESAPAAAPTTNAATPAKAPVSVPAATPQPAQPAK